MVDIKDFLLNFRLKQIGSAILCFAFVATCIFHDSFVKLSFGNRIFALEIIAALAVLLIVLTNDYKSMFEAARVLTKAPELFIFTSLSILLIINDIRTDPNSISKIAQHAILVIYPAIWIPFGLYCAKRTPVLVTGALLFTALINAFQSLSGETLVSHSIGPLAVPLAVFSIGFFLTSSKKSPLLSLSLLLIIPAVARVWRGISDGYVQRTTYILSLLLAIIPGLLFIRKKEMKMASLLFLLILGTGSFFILFVSPTQQPTTSVTSKLVSPFIHGDDYIYRIGHEPVPSLEFRDRKFWWTQAFESWKSAPIIGVGFIPEVPNFIRPNLPNGGNYSPDRLFTDIVTHLQGKALSGPHNSFLSILARTGGLGFICIVALLIRAMFGALQLLKQTKGQLNLPTLTTLILISVFVSSMVHALLHVSFETPKFAMPTWFIVGALLHSYFSTKQLPKS